MKNSLNNDKYNMPNNYLKRRKFIGGILVVIGGMILYGCFGHQQKQNNLPNIVLIISDDQGWGDYGFMGHKNIKTPNLDKLASEGMVFTRGYVTAPLCGPSLASMITGLYPHQNKKTSNDPPYLSQRNSDKGWSIERRYLREKEIYNFTKFQTIPEKLKELKYWSLQTGKWWMGSYRRGGFTHGMTHGDMDRGGRHGDKGLDIGRKTMQPIYDFIDNADNQPFFIQYAPFLPHNPFNAPERILKKYREKTASIHIARYWANCEWFDETCGDLLNYLKKKGIENNTLVLYVCDNGWIQDPNPKNTLYAERSKRTPYEGGIRTPIMIKWPGHVSPKFDKTTLVSSIDLAPTILKACGLDITADMQGVDLLDKISLKNRKAVFGADYTHNAVDINNPVSSLQYSYVLEGEWKLILPSGRNSTGSDPELYNVMEDPDETMNLAAVSPEKVKYLKQLIKEWWSEAVPK